MRRVLSAHRQTNSRPTCQEDSIKKDLTVWFYRQAQCSLLLAPLAFHLFVLWALF